MQKFLSRGEAVSPVVTWLPKAGYTGGHNGAGCLSVLVKVTPSLSTPRLYATTPVRGDCSQSSSVEG